jgi:valyl-tRNA synthetase
MKGLSPQPAAASVCIAPWPAWPEEWRDEAMEARLQRMQALVSGVREVRNHYMLDAGTPLNISVRCSRAVADDFRLLAPFIAQLAGVGEMAFGSDVTKPKQSATRVQADFELYVDLAGLIDVNKEIVRLEKQQGEKQKALQGARGKLENQGFLQRASAEVVQQTRDQAAALEAQLRIIEDTLRDLRQG